ncbi:probable 2-oxoglutarate dehydrogenase E1 component DHKTD1 homolog, mitochondrial [Condylostylus longicornis]|uniref:probable 2-oxoglutarate dehydrogenase E1 component DHKTD1 homolog, mitochondrial n=1 Tax=Condylostylus longicornis TaxID=2530218 RepID=UPI00244DD1DB|nr:probable 2-oxoglutarate dehydrogenase E1 component DHKTD1 homolog, mitochondrial [Condylostylus longicornis]
MYKCILKKSEINFKKYLPILNGKFYHSEKGVYGYRPRPTRSFKVSEDILKSRNSQSNLYRWVEGYRKHGHKLAMIDPVVFKGKNVSAIEELDPKYYGLKPDENVNSLGIFNNLSSKNTVSIAELEVLLKRVYCGSISSEFSYIESTEEKEWLSENYEKILQEKSLIKNTDKIEVAKLLIKSQAWDNFLATKFASVKRYGGEGSESTLAFFYQLFKDSVNDNIKHLVIGMQHRGRGNILTSMLNVRPAKMFKKFQGGSEFPDDAIAMGDVVSHYHVSDKFNVEGKSLLVSMLRNPSHLEAVNPVSMGKTRSKQQTYQDGSYNQDHPEALFSNYALNIQVHGDAAFSGQGVNQECLMMSQVPNFEIGGTIHMIINNQVGFTTPAERGRSSFYSTDLGKSIQSPVFHVNGDDPEDVMLITKLAFQYQRKFRKDVFIDLNCFRRWGHNELDDPSFTNPLLYAVINEKKTVPDMYAEKLVNENILENNQPNEIRNEFMDYLSKELDNTSSYKPEPCYYEKQWKRIQQASPHELTYWDTGLDYSLLQHIGNTSVSFPDDFNIHPHLLKTHVTGRLKKLSEGNKIDWSTAEALAIGSLMYQGHHVRISGEDVGRGTFSQRHCMLVDQKTNEIFIPLNRLNGGYGGKLEVANSILSEEAVLGYEYGMSIDNPNNLIIWEAQFGDFYNGAQIMIDNFIVSGETKWMESNGLVILLPHGYDGAASEHSSCRLERFLQLTDSKENAPDGDIVNLHIVNPTTPAQYYHVLRRQIIRNFRKPLLIVGPKVLIRLSDATSSYTEFEPGTYFKNVIGDDFVERKNVDTVILCSGKHYYNLHNERVSKNYTNTAIIRLESLSPFPFPEVQEEIGKYSNAKNFIWSQEESRNMGAWTFVKPRFEFFVGKKLKYCGRPETPTTAVGDGKIHRQEVEYIVQQPFKM